MGQGLAASSRDNYNQHSMIWEAGTMRDYDFSLYKRLRLRGVGHMTDEEQSLDLNLQLSYS